ncbi:hypothetical protein BT93_G1265 [Corymbia citriodora subsp. variegata]|nr:hypothetical protein BT93_G1265 [Corymbia citriodora subsp. variegata]
MLRSISKALVNPSLSLSLSLSLSIPASSLLRIDLARHELYVHRSNGAFPMAPPPGPYSGTSTLALVARVSAFSFGVVYGSVKLKFLKAKAKSQRKAEAKAHH